MRFTRVRRSTDDEAAILPLINVVFLLLVFFMVAGRLTPAEPVAVTPPRSASEGRMEPATPLLLVDREGRLALDGRIVDEAELSGDLAAHLAGGGDPLVRLKADGGTDAAEVVALMELLRAAGIERLHLLTLPMSRTSER